MALDEPNNFPSVHLNGIPVKRGWICGDVWLRWTLWRALRLDELLERVLALAAVGVNEGHLYRAVWGLDRMVSRWTGIAGGRAGHSARAVFAIARLRDAR